jgi:hypothetical protein
MLKLDDIKRDALAGLKAGGCPASGIQDALKALILDNINQLGNFDRLRAILDDGVLDGPVALNNLHYLFPIAEAEVAKLTAFANECRELKTGRNIRIANECAVEFEQEAKEWARLAKKAAKILGVEPDITKRKWYGVSQFHGFRERVKGGKWIREGGQWSTPKHGEHHAFLTQADAQSWADMQYGRLAHWSVSKGLEVPYKVVEMGPKPHEQLMREG